VRKVFVGRVGSDDSPHCWVDLGMSPVVALNVSVFSFFGKFSKARSPYFSSLRDDLSLLFLVGGLSFSFVEKQ